MYVAFSFLPNRVQQDLLTRDISINEAHKVPPSGDRQAEHLRSRYMSALLPRATGVRGAWRESRLMYREGALNTRHTRMTTEFD